jgi:hypothetical protein
VSAEALRLLLCSLDRSLPKLALLPLRKIPIKKIEAPYLAGASSSTKEKVVLNLLCLKAGFSAGWSGRCP